MSLISLLNIFLIIAIILIVILAIVYISIIINNKKEREKENPKKIEDSKKTKTVAKNEITKASTMDFLEFDDIKDNMIIRKNRTQYVMVIECKGINYDLMSEEEKVSVEEGFTQFLNSLRFPIQLYVQARTLNMRDTIDQYKDRLKNMKNAINELKIKRNNLNIEENPDEYDMLSMQIRKKENVLEYTTDICEYIERLSKNKNVLQQKNYVIVSYYTSELGKTDSFSKEEIDSMCFSEIYTRAQNVSRALFSSGVSGRILDSAELAELLYIAYNRDDEQNMQLSKALDNQYDFLYSTGKDILLKKEEQLDEEIEKESVDLATKAISEADRKLREKEKKKDEIVKEKAIEIVEEYKDQMKKDLYEQTKKEILDESDDSTKVRNSTRGRKPKKEE